VLALSLVASLLPELPAWAAAPAPFQPDPIPHIASVPGVDVPLSSPPASRSGAVVAGDQPDPTWPDGTAVSATGRTDPAGAATAKGAAITVGRAASAPDNKAAAAASSPTRVRLASLTRAQLATSGHFGAAYRISRDDGSTAAASVSVGLDYSG